ncbi:ATP-dependent DNA ligase [Halorubrum sp. JWXQ-INN 858]|uniref:ATP-dependent DNA ligase LigA n=1 Tax=Halorubrum sp. JWXQ-INN 858 TaxID=2690782 RepID=UPI001358E8F8|nr:ATP-dependent DNA ligase LigA [Halorubrum sp. JWXQ-INN 858]MWV64428.1 ATP-dependent DNA ligase [Halorubrum sp. JWXQ-INN 858]
MEFSAFADRMERLEAEPADLETTAAVAALFVRADDELATVTRFLLGRVFPAHDTRTLDVGPATCHEAIARAAGPNVGRSDVEARLAAVGEIGAVAADYEFGGQRGLSAFAGGTDGLTVAEVDATLRELAAADGDGSESRKVEALFGLFNRSEPAEATALARLVLGEMRIGVGEGTVRDAIAEAFLADRGTIPDEDAEEVPVTYATDADVSVVERALQVTNDYGHVATLAREEGVDGLREERLVVGRPVQAMLAQAGTAGDALAEFDSVAVETKFDGARVQVHYVPPDRSPPDGSTPAEGLGPRLYSRNMDDVTDALPEIVEYVADRVDVPVILDAEAIAVDEHGDPLPFQEVLRRFRRKHDVDRMREAVTLELHAFDCLHLDGDDLLDEPLRARHDALVEAVPDAAGTLRIADDAPTIEGIEAAALEAGHEGIMLKDPAGAYTPGDRGRSWLKRKPDVETLDAVVVGAEWGEGRRAELFGTFLLAVRDGDDYQPIGKVATGISDAELAALTDRLEPSVVDGSGTTVSFRPEVVFEVGYEEIQTSPTYASGYALRFPRFVGVREDKDVDDADTLDRVERLAEGTDAGPDRRGDN